MIRGLLVFFLALLQPALVGADLAETLTGVKRSVVAVGTQGTDARRASKLHGSGFVVAGGNHALTTAGAVPAGSEKGGAGGLAIYVPVAGQRVQVRPAREVMRDPRHDLCLLRFDGPALPSLRIGRGSDVREGELHAYTGFPTAGAVGLYPVTHVGIVSAISPNVVPPVSGKLVNLDVLQGLARPYPIFQLDVAAFPGHDGSPLYEPETGRVVGIVNSAFVKQTKELSIKGQSAISYAIPVDHARSLLERAGLAY